MSLNAECTLAAQHIFDVLSVTSDLDRTLFIVYGQTENSKSKAINLIVAELVLLDETVN